MGFIGALAVFIFLGIILQNQRIDGALILAFLLLIGIAFLATHYPIFILAAIVLIVIIVAIKNKQ